MNYLGYKLNGAVTDCVFARDGEFTDEEKASHIADLSVVYGQPTSAFEAFETTTDPYPTATVHPPVVATLTTSVVAAPTLAERIAAIEAKLGMTVVEPQPAS